MLILKELKKIKSAITLIEITIVLAIVGILATLALPQFSKTQERAKEKDARLELTQIRAAERIYRTGTLFYYPRNSTESDIATINANLRTELDTTLERYWDYSITATDNTFVATATRRGPPNNGETITIDEDGDWGGNYSP